MSRDSIAIATRLENAAILCGAVSQSLSVMQENLTKLKQNKPDRFGFWV
jgi:hypothetical protein